jgi:hypothetical protein
VPTIDALVRCAVTEPVRPEDIRASDVDGKAAVETCNGHTAKV